MLKNKKILITGGCGFIGEILVNKLSSDNRVIIIDKKNNLQIKEKIYQKDLTNIKDVLPLFKGVDIVFHLASDISIKYCIESPNESLYNNILVNNNVLECCKKHKIKRLIYSSSAAVYKQKKTNTSYIETDKVEPLNPYSLSKLYGENLCKIYWDLYGIETISLRYFNVYGNSKITNNYASVLNNFLWSHKNNMPLSINGDGNQTRDFVHVDDVVNANLLASTIKLDQYGEIFNVGSGSSITINEIARTISNNVVYNPSLNGELYYSKANISKINNLLKWAPKKNLLKWIKNEIT